MNFLVDAHLPRHLARWLRQVGHDVVHTYDLPLGNKLIYELINETTAEIARKLMEGHEF